MRGLSENIQCENHSFLCWDPLDLSSEKKLSDLVYMHLGELRTAMDDFCWQSVFQKHPNVHPFHATMFRGGPSAIPCIYLLEAFSDLLAFGSVKIAKIEFFYKRGPVFYKIS